MYVFIFSKCTSLKNTIPSDALMIAAQFGTGIKIVPAVWESMENILPQLEQLDADSPDSRAPVYVGEP